MGIWTFFLFGLAGGFASLAGCVCRAILLQRLEIHGEKAFRMNARSRMNTTNEWFRSHVHWNHTHTHIQVRRTYSTLFHVVVVVVVIFRFLLRSKPKRQNHAFYTQVCIVAIALCLYCVHGNNDDGLLYSSDEMDFPRLHLLSLVLMKKPWNEIVFKFQLFTPASLSRTPSLCISFAHLDVDVCVCFPVFSQKQHIIFFFFEKKKKRRKNRFSSAHRSSSPQPLSPLPLFTVVKKLFLSPKRKKKRKINHQELHPLVATTFESGKNTILLSECFAVTMF